jgi:RNA polymerase sigma factor (TIGR02999 family)
MATPGLNVTALLRQASRGDRLAQDELFRLVEPELRQRARARLSREAARHDLQTTVLVDEAFIKLVGDPDRNWESRSQFYCCAARVMRLLFVDEARKRAADKRGRSVRPASLDCVAEPVSRQSLDPLTLLALHEALDKLGMTHPELSQLVELHHFGGWDLKHISEEILHLPYGQVKRRWQTALAFLHREMNGGDNGVAISTAD